MSLWKVNGVNLEITDDSAKDYINRELGLMTTEKRNIGIIASLQNPTKALTDYKAETDLVVVAAGKSFKIDYDKLVAAGLPEENAKRIALKATNGFIQKELEILSLKHPLASNIDLLASSAAKIGAEIHIPNRSDDVYDDKYAKYKRAYDKKKAKKRSKKTITAQ